MSDWSLLTELVAPVTTWASREGEYENAAQAAAVGAAVALIVGAMATQLRAAVAGLRRIADRIPKSTAPASSIRRRSSSPDGRVFVAEKRGVIKVFDNLQTRRLPSSPTSMRMSTTSRDRGLLGLALDPNFPASPYVYVLYTYDFNPFDPDLSRRDDVPRWGTPGVYADPCPTPPGATADGCVVMGRLSRLEAAGNVLTGPEQGACGGWCQQYPSHSVGSLAFDSSGALIVSGGDGASFNFVDYGQDGTPVQSLR